MVGLFIFTSAPPAPRQQDFYRRQGSSWASCPWASPQPFRHPIQLQPINTTDVLTFAIVTIVSAAKISTVCSTNSPFDGGFKHRSQLTSPKPVQGQSYNTKLCNYIWLTACLTESTSFGSCGFQQRIHTSVRYHHYYKKNMLSHSRFHCGRNFM